ncbi:hypothetical protein FAZ95_07830 [Trinickia violacea]|uniref:Uncharacterized protein n=1 Tax=Trinickia violacea TaxID=2571746 RepID=A0A4P8IQC3_9BURK|nr:hypothetical protein [Trinickia violacea]QCP49094.1 hypothetical protein FAZ95_07830 [Trinickia violacea]
MFASLELARYFDQRRLPDGALQLIDSIRSDIPCAAALECRGIRSVVSRNSAKMQRTFWLTARTLRGSAAICLKTGRFVGDEAHHWHDKSCEDNRTQFGIEHRVRNNRELPRIFLENLRYLQDFIAEQIPVLASNTVEGLRRCLHDRPLSYSDMTVRHGDEADILLTALAQGNLRADLCRDRTGDMASFLLYRDAVSVKAGQMLRSPPWEHKTLPLPRFGDCPPRTTLHNEGKEWRVILGTGDDHPERLFVTEDGRNMCVPLCNVMELLAEKVELSVRIASLDPPKVRRFSDLSHEARQDALDEYASVQDEYSIPSLKGGRPNC